LGELTAVKRELNKTAPPRSFKGSTRSKSRIQEACVDICSPIGAGGSEAPGALREVPFSAAAKGCATATLQT
jgi:hypothetical protein